MAEKRRGLGRGLGALIPSGPSSDARPVDVFFPGAPTPAPAPEDTSAEPTTVDAPGPGTVGEQVDGTQTSGPASTDRAGAPAEVPPTGATVAEPTTPTAATNGAAASGDPGAAATDTAPAGSAPTDTASIDTAPAGTTTPAGTDQGGTGSGTADDVDLVPVPGAHFAELPVTSIRPNPRQPRTVFDEEALAELVGSIKEIGVLQPVVVRPVRGEAEDGVRYELIMGERRWRATQEAGLGTIPAIVRETEEHDLLRDALLENLHRSQLNPLEEAAAYQQLLDDFGCTHEELARRIHRSRPQITNTLRLLRLPPLVQRRVAAGVLSAGHARALLGLSDPSAMERLAQRIVAEGLSVRATEEIVALGGGEQARPTPRKPRAGERNAALDDLAARLSDRFDTRVKVQLGRSKGKLTIEFASVQDLNRVLGVLSPDDPGVLR